MIFFPLVIIQVVDTASASLSLIRLYPRLELTADMDVQSMVDLKLTPTGVIIVKVDKVCKHYYNAVSNHTVINYTGVFC